MVNTIHILGCRGVPAAHGGFETLAHMLSLYMVEQGWRACVYCQLPGHARPLETDDWQGVKRIIIHEPNDGALGTIRFDFKAVRHALSSVDAKNDIILTLGYNTAIFSALHRLKKQAHIMNMDGIEWKRQKWSFFERLFLRLNERVGLATANTFIADHPVIKEHLSKHTAAERIRVIPYSATIVAPMKRGELVSLGIDDKPYFAVIARPEPENQILEIVRCFSRKQRKAKLLVLGTFHAKNDYHRRVRAEASDEILFVGAIYEQEIVATIRAHCLAYIHGHTVGGTNPSLVEALAYDNAVIADDNAYNRWTAGEEQLFFNSEDALERHIENCLKDNAITHLQRAARRQFDEYFSYDKVMGAYASTIEAQLGTK